MKSRWIVLLTAVLVACVSGSGSAATYYVATTGSNGNPGTEAQPWATLQYAVDNISSGDTILVKSGTYAGCRIERSGASGQWRTLKAAPGATVVVNRDGSACRHNSNIEVESWTYGTVEYWVIDGLEVTDSAAWGIDLRDTDYVTVQNCNVHDSAITGIFAAFSYHTLIQDNETSYNGEHGVYYNNSGDNATIRGNQSHHNYGCGIHMNGDISMGGDGTLSYLTIEKNVIWENGTGGGSAINCDGVSDSIVRNNVAYKNHAGGVALYVGDGAAGSSRNKVYNNTLVMPTDGRWVVTIPPSYDAEKSDPADNQVKNNILYTYHSFRGSITIHGTSALAAGGSDYNVVIDTFSADDEATRISLSDWQTTYGYDTHSIIATPSQLFINPAADNYRLKAGSPAIDAGTTLADVTEDADGVSRYYGSAYDIGAYELGPVVVDFLATPAMGQKPLTAQFTDLSAGSPTSWQWDFGTGDGSTEQNPSYEYQLAGIYTVSMAATNIYGTDNETKTDYVLVSTFSDVLGDYWSWRQVEACVATGVVQGYGDKTYRPGVQVARDAMAVYIARAMGLATGAYEALFEDVKGPGDPEEQWAWPWIEALARAGIVQGYTATEYRPAVIVKRDAMAVYVARALWGGVEVPTGPEVGRFDDVPDRDPGPAHWAYDEVEYCVTNGVVSGYTATEYRPDNPVDRGQMAVYVQRAFGLSWP